QAQLGDALGRAGQRRLRIPPLPARRQGEDEHEREEPARGGGPGGPGEAPPLDERARIHFARAPPLNERARIHFARAKDQRMNRLRSWFLTRGESFARTSAASMRTARGPLLAPSKDTSSSTVSSTVARRRAPMFSVSRLTSMARRASSRMAS